jgi:hypothetical protein
MNKTIKFAPKPATPARDRRDELLAKLEAALRADPVLRFEDDMGGLDPYNSANGPMKRDAWGARPR